MSNDSVARTTRVVLACLVSLIVACAPESTGETASTLSAAGTGIDASKTATGFWERRITYDWTLDKSVTPTATTLRPGHSGSVDYTLTATRTLASDVMVYGSRGEICVSNTGAIATEGLAIVDQVQVHDGPGPYHDLVGATATITVTAQLAAGESHCYPYEVTLVPVTGATYRNTARVTITNHSGHLGVAFGPGGSHGVVAGFTLPTSYTTVYKDTDADLADVLTCPTGVTCTPATHGPWHLTDSDTITYSTSLAVASTVACATHLSVDNTATLTEATTLQTHDASASVDVYTDVCPVVYQGCTPGYWKNHVLSWSVFSCSATVGAVFSPSSLYSLDGYTLLQGLAFRGGSTNEGAAEILLRAAISALLNSSNSGITYPLSTAQVISQVDAALGSNDRATMIALATVLDVDNNAYCPLH